LKSEHIGGSALLDLYMHWSKFELSQGKAEKALSVLQAAQDIYSLARNPQLLSAIEVLKITGKLNVASVLALSSGPVEKEKPSQQDDMISINEALRYSQMHSEVGANSQPAQRRESINSIASLAVPRISPSEAPGSTVLSTASRLRRLGLGPPKRAVISSLSPIKDSTVPKTRADSNNNLSKETLVELPTPPRQTLRHQEVSLDPSPLSTFSKSRLNYTGSPLTSGIGADEDEEEEEDTIPPMKEKLKPELNFESRIYRIKEEERSNAQATASTTANSVSETQVKTRAVKINGRTYRVLHLIGKGGSSKVFKVLAPDNQVLALKKVNLKNLDDATLSGYVNEIELLRKLGNEENIIKLVDAEFNREHANLYILMEYGEVDLCQMLRERADKPRDYNFIRYCWQQMLHAVQIVHAAKVVHCDLKPANFLMVRGHLKLIDFGISKAIMNDTTNIVRENQVGTVNYMSPEALQESASSAKGLIKIGRPSDVWSLGCILYEMTFGKAPFANFSLIQRLQKIMDTGYQIDFPPSDNPALLASIQGCLDRSIKNRLTIEALLTHPFLMPHLQRVERPLALDLREALARLPPEVKAVLEASLRQLP